MSAQARQAARAGGPRPPRQPDQRTDAQEWKQDRDIRYASFELNGVNIGTKHVDIEATSRNAEYSGPAAVWVSFDTNGDLERRVWPHRWRGPSKWTSMQGIAWAGISRSDVPKKLQDLQAVKSALHTAETCEDPEKEITRAEAILAMEWENSHRVAILFCKVNGFLRYNEMVEAPVFHWRRDEALELYERLRTRYGPVNFPSREVAAIAARFLARILNDLRVGDGESDLYQWLQPRHFDAFIHSVGKMFWRTRGRFSRKSYNPKYTVVNLPRGLELERVNEDTITQLYNDGLNGNICNRDRVRLLMDASPIAVAALSGRKRDIPRLHGQPGAPSFDDSGIPPRPMLRNARKRMYISHHHGHWKAKLWAPEENRGAAPPDPVGHGVRALIYQQQPAAVINDILLRMGEILFNFTHWAIVNLVWHKIVMPLVHSYLGTDEAADEAAGIVISLETVYEQLQYITHGQTWEDWYNSEDLIPFDAAYGLYEVEAEVEVEFQRGLQGADEQEKEEDGEGEEDSEGGEDEDARGNQGTDESSDEGY